MNFWDNTIIIDDGEKRFVGLFNKISFPINDEAYYDYQIEPQFTYRPDKIAYHEYGNAGLSFIIEEVNNIYSLEEYYTGRKIKMLKYEVIESMGLA